MTMFDRQSLFGDVAESREISPGVWAHTIAPPILPISSTTYLNMPDYEIIRAILAQHGTDPDTIIVSRKTMHDLRALRARGRHTHRVQLGKRRQRRASQRRHNRGEA